VKLVTPPLIVEEGDAFKKDVLERASYGESLMNLVSRSTDELVISLDGKWGEGKSTFIKMWRGMLTENGIHSIYIDAFSTDYVDDAFISIASVVTNYFEKNIAESESKKLEELTDKAKRVGVSLLSWGAKIGLKAATLGAIKDSDIEELKDIKGDLSSGVSNLVGSFIEEKLTSHAKDLETIQSFKELLSTMPSKLEGEGNSPLIIIIDELDRCKPTFAVEVIEKIKHIFSVKNVVFVLVMNKGQLEESIRSVYEKWTPFFGHSLRINFCSAYAALDNSHFPKYTSSGVKLSNA